MAETVRKTKKRLSPKRRRRRRSVATLLFILLVAAAAFFIVFLFFRIGEIRVENSVSSVYTGSQITAASGLKTGDNIFSFKTAEAESRLLNTLPYLGQVTVERRLPNTVVIKVSETTDYAAVPYRGGYLIVSADLKILSDSYVIPDDIPVIYGVTPVRFSPGTELSAEDGTAAENLGAILGQVYAYDWFDSVSAVSVRDRLNLSMIFENRIFVDFGTVNRLEYKFEMFYEVVMNQYDETLTGYIDLSQPGKASVRAGNMPIPEGYFDIGNGE